MRIGYNFIQLNQSGVVDACNLLRFDCDQIALAPGREMTHLGQVEVWRGREPVAVLPPAFDRRGPARRRASDAP